MFQQLLFAIVKFNKKILRFWIFFNSNGDYGKANFHSLRNTDKLLTVCWLKKVINIQQIVVLILRFYYFLLNEINPVCLTINPHNKLLLQLSTYLKNQKLNINLNVLNALKLII